MGIDTVTQVAYITASVLSLILTGIFASQIKGGKIHWSFAAASGVQILWLVSVGFGKTLNLSNNHILLMEAAHFSAWIFAISATLQYLCKECLPRYYKIGLFGLCYTIITIDFCHIYNLIDWASPQTLIKLQGIILAIVALLNVEQLYRNVLTVRLIRLLCLNLAIMFVYDVYFFSQSLVKPELNSAFAQLRAILSIVTCAFMGIATISLQYNHDQSARLSFSRPVVFYTTSLSIAGSVLAVIALGGYYVSSYSGDWGTVAYFLILTAAIISIASVFASRNMREQFTVLINKHLFSHKYDYRAEWLKLIKTLSQSTPPEKVHQHAILTVADIFKSDGGALWLRKGKILVPVHQEHVSIDILDAIEVDDSPFIQALEHSAWVFLPSSTNHNDSLAQHNEYLPEWATQDNNIWLILPLINESELIGFMALTQPNGDTSINWEDLDLLKTIGRQVASYLERHEQAEQLAEARQFEAFNKLSAYVMHDLKNLIAQQSLVVKNAEKHKDNPAFIEDAIGTIHNSVSRMNNLLRKLQHNEPDGVRTLLLHDILLEAIRRCKKNTPQPTLRSEDQSMRIKGDQESLIMVFVHIIQNAQDATQSNGFIDIEASQEKNTAVISIDDNGEGMDSNFIRDRLFKPFETTKTGKGMGIGVYQTRDYIQSLGGQVSVTSTPDEGTNFTIAIPLEAS